MNQFQRSTFSREQKGIAMKQKKFPWLTIALAVSNVAIWVLFLKPDQ